MNYNEIFTILKSKKDTDALLCAFSGKSMESYDIFVNEDSKGYTFTKYEDPNNACIDFKVFLFKNQNLVVFMPYIYNSDMSYQSNRIKNLKWYISSCLDSYGIKKYNHDSKIFSMHRKDEEYLFIGTMIHKFKFRIVIEDIDQLLYLIKFFNELNKIISDYQQFNEIFDNKSYIKNVFHEKFIKSLK